MRLRLSLITHHLSLITVLNAERLDAAVLLLLVRKLPHEDRARDVDGREQVRQESEDERDGEAAYRPRAEDEKEERRDDCRHVRVNNRDEGAREAEVYRGRHGLSRAHLLSYALEDEHVRVHGHAYAEDDSGDAGQRQRRLEDDERGERQDGVQEQRHDRVDARPAVVRDHRQDDEREPDARGRDARAYRVRAEARADRPLFEIDNLRWERARL